MSIRFGLAFLLLTGFIAIALGAEMEPFLAYQHEGSHGPYGKIAVVVGKTGQTRVTIEKPRSAPVDYVTDLSREELNALRLVVVGTEFFSEPEQDDASPLRLHAGITEIKVDDGSRTRTLKFGHRPALAPLQQFLWRLVAQAEAFHALESDGDVYTAIGAVNSSYAGTKALQPDRLKDPLMRYFERGENRQKVNWALEGLSAVATPDEIAGCLSRRWLDNQAASKIPPDQARLPLTYRQALCPLYFSYLRTAFPSAAAYIKEGTDSQQIASQLAEARYEPALPYFFGIFDQSPTPASSGMIPLLTNFGLRALDGLEARLESSSEAHRIAAAQVLANISRATRKRFSSERFSERFPAHEYNALRKRFEESIVPKLVAFAEKDLSENFRKEAAGAVRLIQLRLQAPITGPFVTLSVLPDYSLKRTALEGEADKLIIWQVFRDGQSVGNTDAAGHMDLQRNYTTPGVYTAFVSAWSDGDFRVVSNIVFFTIAPPR